MYGFYKNCFMPVKALSYWLVNLDCFVALGRCYKIIVTRSIIVLMAMYSMYRLLIDLCLEKEAMSFFVLFACQE